MHVFVFVRVCVCVRARACVDGIWSRLDQSPDVMHSTHARTHAHAHKWAD